ncbi:MAG: DUF2145 domain-containing protein [Rhodocyclaceae bacterium]
MNTARSLCRALVVAAFAAVAAFSCPGGSAFAGQRCEPRQPSVDELRRNLELAADTARRLDASGAEVVMLARAGQDLSAYGLSYSHLGIAYRDHAALDGRGAWRVVHKLNHCGSDRASVYRHGLAEFFSDGLHRWEAGIVLLPATIQAASLADDRLLAQLHEPRYNMLAYPWASHYQQSNQWALETLALLLEPGADSRERAQAWLRLRDYRPTTLRIRSHQRLGANVGSAHIRFDDHPFDRRMSGRIDTITVDSIFDWLKRSGFGRPEHS